MVKKEVKKEFKCWHNTATKTNFLEDFCLICHKNVTHIRLIDEARRENTNLIWNKFTELVLKNAKKQSDKDLILDFMDWLKKEKERLEKELKP